MSLLYDGVNFHFMPFGVNSGQRHLQIVSGEKSTYIYRVNY
jgi:hypothetical protein